MSDTTLTGSWRGALITALAVAAVAAVATAARLLWFGEALSDRAVLLMLVAAAGGFSAMTATAFPALWLATNWSPLLRSLGGGIYAGVLFIPATLFFFALKIRVVDGRIEADAVTDLGPTELFWSMFGAMGMFTPTGLRYLVPWAALAVAATACAILYRWPNRSSR